MFVFSVLNIIKESESVLGQLYGCRILLLIFYGAMIFGNQCLLWHFLYTFQVRRCMFIRKFFSLRTIRNILKNRFGKFYNKLVIFRIMQTLIVLLLLNLSPLSLSLSLSYAPLCLCLSVETKYY